MEDRDPTTGRFAKGRKKTGGRKVGSTEPYRRQALKAAPEIIEKLIEMAKAGDISAGKLLIDRIWPVQTQRELDLTQEIDELHERIAELEQELEARRLRRVA